MNKELIIYTIKNCPYCKDLKEKLDSKNISYKDKDVELEENKDEFNKILEVSKAEEVPILRIDKQLFVPNVSFKSIDEIVSLIDRIFN